MEKLSARGCLTIVGIIVAIGFIVSGVIEWLL